MTSWESLSLTTFSRNSVGLQGTAFFFFWMKRYFLDGNNEKDYEVVKVYNSFGLTPHSYA